MLLDQYQRPLKDLRISVTDRCNFRCGYCMPKEVFKKGYPFLQNRHLLSFEEMTRLASIFVSLGVDKLRITGGEPLLRRDIEQFIAMLHNIEGSVNIAMTTNASLLTQQNVAALRAAGLTRMNISLDALDPDISAKMNPVGGSVERVLKGIEYALAGGFSSLKVNMVVQKGINDSDILPMVEYFRGSGVILRFIEFMDVGNYNNWSLNQVFSAADILQRIQQHHPLTPLEENYQGEVAKRWKFQDGQGEIGIISSITQPFCGDCSRARLSPSGELYTCLFASKGTSLKSLLRSTNNDNDIRQFIIQNWQQRNDRYSELRNKNQGQDQNKLHVTFNPNTKANQPKVEMSFIGG